MQSLVYIPIVGNQLETLLEKYNYCVPKICEVEIDRKIKDICERLSVSIPSLAVKKKTILKKTRKNTLYTQTRREEENCLRLMRKESV